MSMRPLIRYATPVAWLSSLAALAWWLVRMGEGRLSGPPLGQPTEWASWATSTGPVDASFALLRLACLIVVVYLAGAMLIEVAAQATGARPLRRASDALSIALVRRIVSGSIGMSVTAGALAAGTTAVAAAPLRPGLTTASGTQSLFPADSSALSDSRRLVMRPLASRTTLTMEPTAVPAAPPPATMSIRATPNGAPSSTMSMRASTMSMRATPATARTTMRAELPTSAPIAPSMSSSVAMEAASPAPPTAAADALETRVLGPGDHLWAVAEERVADVLQRPGTDDEITTYWLRLVQLNRAELADPDNPDLVFPGQTIRLPPG
ncbi:MAG: resuscitation-promoting factor RpfA [Acidimicrobiia bacterium]|nr:resuscitation-promoting factor RpfA [Acidimicrobiia bacterium]